MCMYSVSVYERFGNKLIKNRSFFFSALSEEHRHWTENSTSWEVKSFSGQFVVRVCVCVRLMWNVKQVNWLLITLTHTVRVSRLWELWECVWVGVLSLLGHTGFFRHRLSLGLHIEWSRQSKWFPNWVWVGLGSGLGCPYFYQSQGMDKSCFQVQ